MRRVTARIRLAAVLLLASAISPGAAQSPSDPAAAACARLDRRLHSVTERDCESARLAAAEARTALGHPILWRDYAPAAGSGMRRVLLIGGIHGDELSSVSIVFHWMRKLAAEGGGNIHWRIVPCLNPDGVLRNPSRRTNARGVDLNRNLPTPDWHERALAYWQRETGWDPRRYPGTAPQSEAETRWLVGEIERFRPDAVVSVHAPYGVLDFDGPRTPPRKIAFLDLKLLGTYPGSLGNYAGVHLGLPVLTLELPHAFQMPTPTQVSALWADLVAWLDRHVPPRPVESPPVTPPGG